VIVAIRWTNRKHAWRFNSHAAAWVCHLCSLSVAELIAWDKGPEWYSRTHAGLCQAQR
jgi:hypothetical protein